MTAPVREFNIIVAGVGEQSMVLMSAHKEVTV